MSISGSRQPDSRETRELTTDLHSLGGSAQHLSQTLHGGRGKVGVLGAQHLEHPAHQRQRGRPGALHAQRAV